ncbi:MAG: hypothetical protein ACHQ0Y_13110 [Thermodesulfovibrionales bacterium]
MTNSGGLSQNQAQRHVGPHPYHAVTNLFHSEKLFYREQAKARCLSL